MSKKAKSAINGHSNNIIFNNVRQNDLNNAISESESQISIKSNGKINYISDNLITQEINLSNISKLKSNLKPDIKDDQIIINELEKFISDSQIYEQSFNNPIFSNYKFDDEIFEKKINEILVTSMNLTSFDYFPILQVYNSKKGKIVSSLSYYKIKIKDEDDSETKEFCYLAKKNNIYISFKNYVILLELENYNLQRVIINTNDFKKRIAKQYIVKENNKTFKTFFYIGEIENNSDFTLESNKKQIENINNEIVDSIDNNASLSVLKEKTAEIKLLKTYNKKIDISIELIEKELDGFYKANSEHIFNLGNKQIKIEKNSFIILEVKNHKDIKSIIKNIFQKKKLLLKLGINFDHIYFIGVLNSTPIKAKENNESNIYEIIEKYLEQKIIILFPENLQLLEESIYSQKVFSSGIVTKLNTKIENIENHIIQNLTKFINEKFNSLESSLSKENKTNGQ